MPRVAALALLLLACAASSASPAGAATRPVAFVPVAAPAIGTCATGSAEAVRVLLARDAASRAEAAPCLGAGVVAGRVLVVLAPDASAAGTTVQVRRVEVVGPRSRPVLRVTASITAPSEDAFLAQVLTTPRAAVRLGAGALPSRWTVVDEAGHVLAHGVA